MLALSVGSTLVSAPISTTTRLILIPSTDQEERDFDILGIISQELLPGNMPIAGAVYTSIIAYALTASQVVFPHQMLPNPPELASASKNLPCKYLLFFLTAHASIKLSKIAVFGRDARSKLSRKNVFPKRVVRYDGPVERLVSMGERLASMGERLASMGEQVTKESDLLDKLNGGESGNRRGGDGGCLPVPAEGGAREGDGVKSRQRRSSGSGTASPHTSSQHSPMVSLGNSSRGNSRSASAENLMFLIERDLARETRERELLKEVEKESELARGNLSSGGSESGRSLFGIASSATPSLSSQKSGLGRRLSNPRRKGKANKVLSPLTPAQVQQVLSTSSSIAGLRSPPPPLGARHHSPTHHSTHHSSTHPTTLI